MALFDRVDSGFPELDEALDYFRIGDNVVCRLTELDGAMSLSYISDMAPFF